ncbi:MAG: penicillin-binding protein 2 [Chloroflexi bacterium]|nr:penicillin-binding protein 2 [Chloroflexota bacterium]
MTQYPVGHPGGHESWLGAPVARYTGADFRLLAGFMLDSGEPRGTSALAPHLFRGAVLLLFMVLAAQLWRLQIVEGAQLRQRADSNRVRVSPIPPPRGVIYDRGGTIVASNAPSFVVSIVPADSKPSQEAEVFGRLSSLLGVPVGDIRKAVEKRRADGHDFTPVPIRSSVPRESALLVEQQLANMPGVTVTVESARRYAEGRLLAHIIGYLGPISPSVLTPADYKQKIEREGYSINDRIGAAGLEDAYESILRGKPGRRMYEVEASGREVSVLRSENAEPGKNLLLTVDLDLQRRVTEILSEGLHQGNVGAAIVSDAKSGEILALVSLPSYDDNLFGDDSREEELANLLKDPEQPFFHRAIAGNYPPGSTFKLVTALGALQEHVATRDTRINSKGVIYVPHDFYPGVSQRFPDWPGAPQGRLNLIQAIANSTNVHFFYLGGGYEPEGFVGLGNERLARYARMIGFGSPTGIDLPGESAGTIPDEDWKLQRIGEKWVKGDTYNMSIGQGYVEATPLQVHGMTMAIANGGKVLRPHVVKKIVDADGNVVMEARPDVLRTLEIDPQHFQTIVEGMEAGFSGPLLRDFRVPGLRIAGKTGTAEYGQAANPQGELPTHGWFTGFAPIEDPKVVVTVFVERGSSSRDAAPIAARIIRHIFGQPDIPAGPGSPPPPAPAPAASPGPSASPAPLVPPVAAPPQPGARPPAPEQAAPTPATRSGLPTSAPSRQSPATTPATAPTAASTTAPGAAPTRASPPTPASVPPRQGTSGAPSSAPPANSGPASAPTANPAVVPKPPSLFQPGNGVGPAPTPKPRN